VKALVADLKTVEPIYQAQAKSSNFSPSKSQKAAAEKFLNQAAAVRRDLGLAPAQEGI
jgi:hypothetical protein